MRSCIVGVISDTHGLMRPEALECLRKSDLIVHCGDVGASAVLDALKRIAPVHAVRGNNDQGPWAAALPPHTTVKVGRREIYVIHNLAELEVDPAVSHYAAILYGHSHRPKMERRGGVLFLNPGSAGPRRFSLPVAVAILKIGAAIGARIVELNPGSGPPP